MLEEATVEDDVDVGPFAHLRKGAHLATGVHVGNFGEIKNSWGPAPRWAISATWVMLRWVPTSTSGPAPLPATTMASESALRSLKMMSS